MDSINHTGPCPPFTVPFSDVVILNNDAKTSHIKHTHPHTYPVTVQSIYNNINVCRIPFGTAWSVMIRLTYYIHATYQKRVYYTGCFSTMPACVRDTESRRCDTLLMFHFIACIECRTTLGGDLLIYVVLVRLHRRNVPRWLWITYVNVAQVSPRVHTTLKARARVPVNINAAYAAVHTQKWGFV